ncbi:uncharacterized protein LOC100879765 [Megachile rotundata]|uniref:uncharacterized protein LOC100879765 n=1 Tax=Megachile rotundata TaxID=143995 RepID=UPI003FD624DD
MAFIIENRQVSEINNKGKEQFLSFEMKEDYSFKYVPESHFKHIVKNVQRQRRKEDEERIWTSFIKEQELNNFGFCKQDGHRSMLNVKDLLQENIQDVDTELKRLQEDALPERNKRIHNNKSGIRREKIHIEANQSKSDSPKEKLLIKDKSNAGTNVSIPISREDNVSPYKESEGFKKISRSKTKKSRSDSLIMQKKYYTNELLRATNHFENNSDSDSSNNKDDVVYIQPDPFMIQKILSMQKKVAELLNEISFRLCRIPLPDGDNDLKRRQQQTVEFAIWFSRNYLYNLNRLVTSIQRHIRIVSSRVGLNRHKNIALHQDMIRQKLITAHQLLVQALNAYCKHIPNSILESHCTKLRDVLQVVYDLGDICDKVEISANYFCSGDTTITSLGKDLREKCDTILSNLKLSLENKNRLPQYKNSESTVTLAPVSSRHKGHVNRKNLSGRLSMYNMDVKISKNNQKKKNILRRKSYTCQKETKNNVVESKNLYVQHCSVPELLYPSPVSCTSSSKEIVQTGSMKNASCLKEDEIKTMMDGVSLDSEHDSNRNTHTKYKNVEQPTATRKKSSVDICQSKHTKKKEICQKVEDVTNDDDLFKKVTAISKEHLATLAPVLSGLVTLVSKKKIESKEKPVSETSVEALIEFLQKYQSPKDSDTKAPLTDEDSDQYDSKLNGSSNVQKQDANVRLICMSSTDKISKTTQCNVSCQADCETTLKDNDDKKTANTKDKVMLTVSKETELQFLSYRLEYQKQCQSKPMYSSNTQNKPWNIVAWISDKLIEELITEITTELQMNECSANEDRLGHLLSSNSYANINK